MKTIKKQSEILESYTLKPNEQAVCIENYDSENYKIYAIYVNKEYDRRIKVKKY